jgi:hypothetical protein
MRYQSLAVAALLAVSGSAFADSVTFSGSAGGRAASAVFATSGSTLTVTLTNTATDDVTLPIFVLTGVYFDVSGSALSLTRTSALLNTGSTVINAASQPAGGVVGGEWAYKSGLSGAAGGAAYGISSSGLGLFGPGDRFPGDNLDGPNDPDGLQYGITTAGDDSSTNNGGTNTPLIKNSVVFTLSGLPTGFDINRFRNVGFQYGTALDEPQLPSNLTVVPLPAGATAGLSALAGVAVVGGLRRRRLQA